MPKTTVYLFRDSTGRSPIVDWLVSLRASDRRAYTKCVAAIRRLASDGYELHRPRADYLRDGIHELRTRAGHVNYRLLYFFHGRNVAVISHGVTKEDAILPADIERAITRMRHFESDPRLHVSMEELP
jgi:hypothetical protein